MNYGNLKVPENVTPEVQTILDSYDARNKEIENAHRKNTGRIWLGSALSGASALPVFNIPYVGTGLGGALYELGQGIAEGDKLPELAKRTGTGFAIGETVGAIPYAGKYANKLSGGKIGNALTAGVEKIASTPLGQKVAEIAPKVEDLLMTDIKAFNPFKQTQTAYHGSPYDFAKFSNEAIGTGEGAQAHGYGHYAAKSQDVADGYRKRLGASNTETNIEELKDLNKGFKYNLLARGKEDTLNKLNELIEANKNIPDKLQEFEKYKNIVENFNENNLVPSGQLYKLSIPKDDVMLREGATFAEQPVKVQNILKREYFDKINANLPLKHQKTPEEILETIGDNNLFRFIKNKTGIEDSLELNNLLNKQGIKGISYNGGIDGEANVIFNPGDIQIVRKYYNQPQAMEYFQKFQPNFGAVVNSIETNPVNTKEWKQYAKNNLIGNSVDVPGYTTVNFTNKNLGKDYPYNMPEYETLLDDLTKSKYAFSTNYNNEADRFYDHLVSDRKGLFDYLIEVIQDTEGNIHHNYKMMKNINRGDKP